MRTVLLADLLEESRSGFWGSDAGTGITDVRVIRNGDIQEDGVRWHALPLRGVSRAEADSAAIRQNDILMTTSGNCGYSAHVSEPPSELTIASNFVRILRFNADTVVPRYIFHFIHSDQFRSRLSPYIRGTTLKNLSLPAAAERIDVPLPNLTVQRRVAGILDKADAQRAKRRGVLAQLETLKQSIFLELFGDPVSNPRKWPVERLETFFHFRTGKLDSNAAVATGQYPFFTCAKEDFRIDTFAFDCEALLLAGNNASADYSVKLYRGKFNAYQRTYVITLRNERNSYEYSRFVLEHRLGELKRMSKGTGTKYLTLELLNRIQVPVPPQELQREFARRVNSVEQLKAAHMASSTELGTLFASLWNRAFQGNL